METTFDTIVWSGCRYGLSFVMAGMIASDGRETTRTSDSFAAVLFSTPSMLPCISVW